MKKIICILVVMVCLTACAYPNPRETVFILNPGDSVFIRIPKGFLDDSENYMTEEEWQAYKENQFKMREEIIKELQKQKNRFNI